MLPPNNSYYSSITSYPHRSSHRRPRVRDDRRGAGGENPPPKRDGGVSAARSSGPRPSPSPATPELAPHDPWDPLQVPATNAAAPLFLRPALSLIHPALYLPASIFVFLTPARNTASLLAAPPLPLPPTATTTPSTSAASKPRGTHRRRTSGHGPPSLRRCRPRRPGRGGGEGRRTQRPVTPGIVQPLGQVPPHGHSSSSSSSSEARGGGAPAAAVAGRGGSDGRGSGGGDNDMFCCGFVVVCFVFLGGDACGVCAETWRAS
jgi:hypothetical protein